MKFSSKEDVEAPIEQVFEMLCEFETFERSALRRGADVSRLDQLQQTGVGMMWETAFRMRGKVREMTITLTEYEPPNYMLFQSVGTGFEALFSIELMALSRSRTRIAVELDLKPKTLSARLLIQSLKLAKSNLNKRFKLRVADYAKDMEDRYERFA